MKVIAQGGLLPKRDIVDTSTHPQTQKLHKSAHQCAFPTIWRNTEKWQSAESERESGQMAKARWSILLDNSEVTATEYVCTL